MDKNTCLIITSIHGSGNEIVRTYARHCSEIGSGFILAGDVKTPEPFDLPGCEYLGVTTQKKLPFQLATLLPDNNYSKKNMAYLQAIKKGYTVIVETDDDNLPLENFWTKRNANVEGDFLENKNWVNTYSYFSDSGIWPRGFPLDKIQGPIPEIDKIVYRSYFCPIQQGLADENPDVDAVYRLTRQLPVYFKKRSPIVLGNKSICPFNSQNTTWFRASFPLLYLPSYCGFRMCDIWRSFVAQRILWVNNWHLAFHEATVCQKRNQHDLLKDFEQEVTGYLYNTPVMALLDGLNLTPGEKQIPANMLQCYRELVEQKFVDKQELTLLEAWLNDLES